MLRIITDFDGPVMDLSERYYRVYQFCLEQTRRLDQEVNQLSKEQFWNLKRSRTPETQIGIISGLDEAQAQKFAQLRNLTAHTLPYLIYDQVSPGAVKALTKIQQAGVDLVVLTMRRVIELDFALTHYDLAKFFPTHRCYRITNDYVKSSDVADKPLLMKQALAELPPATETWMIGDTEADIVAAKMHGIKVIGVLSGIRDRQQLEHYQPDLILSNLSEAVDFIFSSTSSLQSHTNLKNDGDKWIYEKLIK